MPPQMTAPASQGGSRLLSNFGGFSRLCLPVDVRLAPKKQTFARTRDKWKPY
jgi:hypothetical protein